MITITATLRNAIIILYADLAFPLHPPQKKPCKEHIIKKCRCRNKAGLALVTSSKLTLSRVRLALGLATTFDLSTTPAFSRPIRPTQPDRPSLGRCNKYWRWGRNSEFCVPVGPVTRIAGVLAYCTWASLRLTLAGLKGQWGRAPSRRTSLSICVNLVR